MPSMTLAQEQLQTQSLGARGYQMLSVMRAVTMMPNSTVSAHLLSSDHVGGKLQLVFPISQEEFDSLLSGELEAEVCLVKVQDVVQSGAQDDELEYSDGWETDCSVSPNIKASPTSIASTSPSAPSLKRSSMDKYSDGLVHSNASNQATICFKSSTSRSSAAFFARRSMRSSDH
ncbi:hypothetical protein BDM02DRAFT_3193239 [Thelephora ganbajun]|uniref:Uncharacterized protein n=1 Tax=Thelephora ganbajun TaxID=370292 RepID=A0ACB6YZE4_THEGA|nr:hypothetical protein BDM02DRAFT_3193239 [Thelephora ganbajun]